MPCIAWCWWWALTKHTLTCCSLCNLYPIDIKLGDHVVRSSENLPETQELFEVWISHCVNLTQDQPPKNSKICRRRNRESSWIQGLQKGDARWIGTLTKRRTTCLQRAWVQVLRVAAQYSEGVARYLFQRMMRMIIIIILKWVPHHKACMQTYASARRTLYVSLELQVQIWC